MGTEKIDLILITQSEVVQYEEYSRMPIDRIDLYRNLVQLRMVYWDNGFHSHLDLFNKVLFGKYFHEGLCEQKRSLFSIWNMPGLNGIAAIHPFMEAGLVCRVINNFDAEWDLLLEYSTHMSLPIIGISTTFILQWSEIGRMVKKIQENIQNPLIVLGGAFVNDQFLTKGPDILEKPMRKYGISCILHSLNPEPDIASFAQALQNDTDTFDNVNNLIYIDREGRYKVTPTVWNKPSLSKILPYKDIVDHHIPSKTVQIRTSSGCPFRCAFCSYPAVAHGFHHSSMEQIEKQLDAVRDMNSVEAIVFVDDTFNFPVSRFREIVSLLKKYDFRWYAFYRAQLADENLIRDMKKSGCDGLYLGLESASDTVLRNMNKKARVDDYRRTIAMMKKNNILLFGMFILGFPGETEESVESNVSFIEETELDFFSVKEFYYLHTAPVFQKRSEYALEGEGYRWKHKTMTSTTASELKLKMFEEIQGSLFVDPDPGLWYLIYLRDRGFSWGTIKNCQNIINAMLRQDNAGRFEEKERLINRFRLAVSEYRRTS
jgi:anaerobic magnesium-protoporphyrin IX monomethyl ester cyclase